MDLSLATILIALGIAPSLLFRQAHYRTKRIGYIELGDYESLVQLFPRHWQFSIGVAILLACLIHLSYWLIWYWGSGAITCLGGFSFLGGKSAPSYPISVALLDSLIAGPHRISIIINNIHWISLQGFLVCCYAIILGWWSGHIRWNRLERWRLRTIPNRWYYQFFPRGPDNVCVLDVLSRVERPSGYHCIYRGYLDNFEIDERGDLATVTLANPLRAEIPIRGAEPQEDAFKHYAIPGDLLVIPYSEIQNLNITFVRLTDLDKFSEEYASRAKEKTKSEKSGRELSKRKRGSS